MFQLTRWILSALASLAFLSEAHGADQSCTHDVAKLKYKGKTFNELFVHSVSTVKGVNGMFWGWKSKTKLSVAEQEDLIISVLSEVDSAIDKSTCKSTFNRVFFVFSDRSYSISRNQLVRLRHFKKAPLVWAGQVLRSQKVVSRG